MKPRPTTARASAGLDRFLFSSSYGKARNTAVILKKAVKMPGATHIAYTKGEAGYATTRAQVLSCPNPNLKTKDPETMAYQREYLEHD